MPKPSFTKVFVEKPKPKRNNQKSKGHYTYYTSVYEPKPNQNRVNDENYIRKEEPAIRNENIKRKTHFEKEGGKTMEILITNFKFYPQKIIVASGTTVTWRVDKNESIHESSVYGLETRSFVINVKHGSEIFESELLSKDQTFSYRFTKSGKYQIQCANYLQIQGIIEVSNDGSQSCFAEPEPMRVSDSFGEEKQNKNPWEDELETKNSLLLFKELENDGIKELILELSMKSASDKGGKDYGLLGEDEIIMDQNRRYDSVANGLRNQKEMNIYDSLMSREFNGLKLRSRDQSIKSERDHSHRMKSEDNIFLKRKKVYGDVDDEEEDEVQRELNFDLPKEYVEARLEMFKQPILFSLKNPKDEEQQFAINQGQECISMDEVEEPTAAITEEKKLERPGEDLFFAFLKKELKEPVKKLKKKVNRNNYYKRRRNNSKNKTEEDMDRISALKDFLENRYDFADAFN